jgi:elongation factor 3
MSAFAELVNAGDVDSLVSSISKLSLASNDLKTIFESFAETMSKNGKDEAAKAEKAIKTITSLVTSTSNPSLYAQVESYLVALVLPALFKAAAHKNTPVRAAATEAVQAIGAKLTPNSIQAVLPLIFSASKIEENWQTRALALRTLAGFGDHAPVQLGYSLPHVVPEVTVSMTDTKKEVKEAAVAAMTAACEVIGNRDIEHMTTHILRSITNPEDVPEIMHKLAGVTFVQSVQSPALAMVVPLLLRGLRSRVTATRRQSAVIIDNMSKLVDDPIDAAPFLPLLQPALAACADAMSDPEARGVAERASAQLNKLADKVAHLKTTAISHDAVLAALKAKLPAAVQTADVALNHITYIITMLMGLKQFETEQWNDVSVHLTNLLTGISSPTAAEVIALLIPETKEMCTWSWSLMKMMMIPRSSATASSLLPTAPRFFFTTL